MKIDKNLIESWCRIKEDGNQRFTGKSDFDLSLNDRTEKGKWIDNNVNMALHGCMILGKVRAEFSDNDFSRKFEMDYRQAKSNNPDKSLGYFLAEEIKRISTIMWAIETCIENYEQHDEHITLANYLTFLHESGKQPTSGTTLHTDLSKLDELFLPDAVSAKKVKRLKMDIETFLPGYNKKQIAALAAVIYYSGLLHNATKPKDFKAWQRIFCEILGKDVSTYKKNQLTGEITQLKGTYYYFVP